MFSLQNSSVVVTTQQLYNLEKVGQQISEFAACASSRRIEKLAIMQGKIQIDLQVERITAVCESILKKCLVTLDSFKRQNDAQGLLQSLQPKVREAKLFLDLLENGSTTKEWQIRATQLLGNCHAIGIDFLLSCGHPTKAVIDPKHSGSFGHLEVKKLIESYVENPYQNLHTLSKTLKELEGELTQKKLDEYLDDANKAITLKGGKGNKAYTDLLNILYAAGARSPDKN